MNADFVWFKFVQRLYSVIGIIWNISTVIVNVAALIILFNENLLSTFAWGYFCVNAAIYLINKSGHLFALGIGWVLTGKNLGIRIPFLIVFADVLFAAITGPLCYIISAILYHIARKNAREELKPVSKELGLSLDELAYHMKLVCKDNPGISVNDSIELIKKRI
jgi:hypothetical protein